MVVAILDVRNRTLCIANGGQLAPLLRRHGEIRRIEVQGPRFPAGVRRHVRYDDLTIALEPDDLVLFCTDGVTEAMNAQQEEFGDARLDALAISANGASAREIVGRIVDHVQQFAGAAGYHDDITVVAVRSMCKRDGRSSPRHTLIVREMPTRCSLRFTPGPGRTHALRPERGRTIAPSLIRTPTMT